MAKGYVGRNQGDYRILPGGDEQPAPPAYGRNQSIYRDGVDYSYENYERITRQLGKNPSRIGYEEWLKRFQR